MPRSILALTAALFITPETRADYPFTITPPGAKELARAKFERPRDNVATLKRQKLETIRREYEARNKELLAGRGVLYFLYEASRHLLDAELDVSETEADRVVAWNGQWNRAELLEILIRAIYDAGRISTKDYWESEYERMQAEFHLARVRAKTGQLPPSAGAASLPSDAIAIKQFAKAKFEASQSSVKELGEAKAKLAQDAYKARCRNFMAGYGTLSIMLQASLRWRDAVLAQSNDETDRVTAFEREWESAWMTEVISRARFDAHRYAVQDYLESKEARLDAEIRLIRVRVEQAKPLAWQGATWITSDLLGFGSFDFKTVAKAKAEVGHTGLPTLVQTKLKAAGEQNAARESEFRKGRGTLDAMLEVSLDLLNAEREANESERDKLLALERYWERSTLIEETSNRLYEIGRIAIQNLLQPRYFRLQAEIWLLQAQASRQPR